MDALSPVVDSLEKVAESLRPLYEERDGGFVLKVNVREHPDTLALRKALDEERGSVKTWKQKAAEFESLGFTPQQISELKREHDELKNKGKGGDAETIESLRKKFETEYGTKVTAAEQRAQEFEQKLLDRDISDTVRLAMIDAKVRRDEIEDQLRLNRHRFDMKDGKVIVLDEDGRPDTMTVEKYWKDYYKAKKPRVYEGSDAGGMGAGSGGGGGVATGDMTITRTDAKDPRKYQAAKARAEKEGRPLKLIDG
jgi:hypothetical protein